MSFDATMNWAKLRAMIQGLWPAWNVTPEQAGEWKAALASRNPTWTEGAVRAHYRESKWKEPKLGAILEHFRRTAQANGTARSPAAPDFEIERWEKESHESHVVMLRKLIAVEPDRLSRASQYLNNRSMIQKTGSDNPADWSRFAVGMVYTLLFDPPTDRLRQWETVFFAKPCAPPPRECMEPEEQLA